MPSWVPALLTAVLILSSRSDGLALTVGPFVFFPGEAAGGEPEQTEPALTPEEEYEEALSWRGYFDVSLIDLVGLEAYEEWITLYETHSVYQFIEDMGITEEMMREALSPYIYEGYMKYWPEQ